MVNRDVVKRRIGKAKEYLDFLKEIKDDYELKEFKQDPKIYGSTERFLHLCIEAILDIGNHIIADEELGSVDYYSDIPEILSENDYISEELKDIFIRIIGFRNILVHDYLEVDLDIVYKILTDNLSDLEDILKDLAQVL